MKSKAKGPVSRHKSLVEAVEKEYRKKGLPKARAAHIAFAVAGKVDRLKSKATRLGRRKSK